MYGLFAWCQFVHLVGPFVSGPDRTAAWSNMVFLLFMGAAVRKMRIVERMLGRQQKWGLKTVSVFGLENSKKAD